MSPIPRRGAALYMLILLRGLWPTGSYLGKIDTLPCPRLLVLTESLRSNNFLSWMPLEVPANNFLHASSISSSSTAMFFFVCCLGLGKDAFVMAYLGCHVTICERNPVVYALLRDGIQRAQQVPDWQSLCLFFCCVHVEKKTHISTLFSLCVWC